MIKQPHQNLTANLSPWRLRVPLAAFLLAVLAWQSVGIDDLSSAVLGAASWIILLHVFVGEYVFIRYLHAVSRIHQVLDGFASLLLLGGLFSLRRPESWCAFLAGAFALAIVKYLLVEQHIANPALRNYAKEKIIWESPAVCLFSILAVIIDRLPSGSSAARLIEISILIASALFAFWMISVRHIYRKVAARAKHTDQNI